MGSFLCESEKQDSNKGMTYKSYCLVIPAGRYGPRTAGSRHDGRQAVHERKDNPIPLVYDLIEPLCPLVDRAVLDFALSHTFTPGDFTINQWGGCRLNPQLAKIVASKSCTLDFVSNIQDFLVLLRTRFGIATHLEQCFIALRGVSRYQGSTVRGNYGRYRRRN